MGTCGAMRRRSVVVKEKMASIAASASLPSRSLASPAIASGSISKIGSMPTQMGEPLASMAASSRSEKISSMARGMIAAAAGAGEEQSERSRKKHGGLGERRVGAGEIDLQDWIAGELA